MFKHTVKVSFVTIFLFTSCYCYTPIVLWHGITDTCCNNTVTGKLQRDLLEYLPGVHVVSLQIGNSREEDYMNSIFMHPNKQIEKACEIIKSDPLLADGYHGVGYSQGGQYMRGLAQRCPYPRMKSLVSLAGQQQGVYGVPHCDGSILFCDILRQLGNRFAYLGISQKFLAPATYWQNPLNRTAYIKRSTFLSDLNNERFINRSYIDNLQALESFVMVKYEADVTILPSESEWFGFYKPGQSKVVETLQESELYINDRLGLKKMNEEGKLYFLTAPWSHKDFEWHWFRDNIVDKFFV